MQASAPDICTITVYLLTYLRSGLGLHSCRQMAAQYVGTVLQYFGELFQYSVLGVCCILVAAESR